MLLLPILVISGCSKTSESDRFEKYLDKSLAEISGPVAMIQFDIKVARDIDCLVSEALSMVDDKDELTLKDKQLDILHNFTSVSKSKCAFYKAVESDTDKLFSEIKKNRKIPQEVYSFVAVDYSSETSNAIEIGLFDSIQKCERFESFARSIGFATTNCKKWENTIL